MKTISTSAIVALMTAAIGLGAVAPALAQEAAAPAPAPSTEAQPAEPANPGNSGFRNGPGPRHGGDFGGPGLIDVERGAEAIEIAIVRLSHAIDLTDEQTDLLDHLKTDALAASAAFETSTDGLRPTPPAEGEAAVMPDLSERFNNRIAVDTARLAALEAVQPSFTAFFDSLTDEQKAELMPERGQGPGGPGKHHGGERRMGPGNR